jgi:hypothetical protein
MAISLMIPPSGVLYSPDIELFNANFGQKRTRDSSGIEGNVSVVAGKSLSFSSSFADEGNRVKKKLCIENKEHFKVSLVLADLVDNVVDRESSVEEEGTIKWIEQEEWSLVLGGIAEEVDFESSWSRFSDVFSVESPNQRSLWITLDESKEQYVKITLEKGDFFLSNTLTQESLGEVGSKYYYLKLEEYLESGDSERPMVQMRIKEDGKSGEIIWLQSGKCGISGKRALELCTQLQDSLGIESLLLNDDAKYKNIALRYWVPLSGDTLQTWYEKEGQFMPLELSDGVSACVGSGTINQNPIAYKAALTHIKSLSLFKLYEMNSSYYTTRNCLGKLIKNYLKVDVFNSKSLSSFTITDLIGSIKERSRSFEVAINIKEKALKDSVTFCKKFLYVFKPLSSDSEDIKEYARCLNIIESTRIFSRAFRASV